MLQGRVRISIQGNRRKLVSPSAAMNRLENEVGPLGHNGARKQPDFVAECPVGCIQVGVFRLSLGKTVPPRLVGAIDVRPGRREEHEPPIRAGFAQALRQRYPAESLKRCSGVDQPSVEENRTSVPCRAFEIHGGDAQRLAQKGCHVGPWQGVAALSNLLGDDPPPGFGDGRMTAPPQFPEQG